MSVVALQQFFMWCTILNLGLLIIASLILILAGDWAFRIHGSLFPISREAFYVVIYSWLGLLKILIIVFNLVPWLALLIIG